MISSRSTCSSDSFHENMANEGRTVGASEWMYPRTNRAFNLRSAYRSQNSLELSRSSSICFASSFSDLPKQAFHSADNLDGLKRKYVSSASLLNEQYDGRPPQRSMSMQSLTGKHNPKYKHVQSKVVQYIAAIKQQNMKSKQRQAESQVSLNQIHLTSDEGEEGEDLKNSSTEHLHQALLSERKTKKELQLHIKRLQESYNELLVKYARAEDVIDRLKLSEVGSKSRSQSLASGLENLGHRFENGFDGSYPPYPVPQQAAYVKANHHVEPVGYIDVVRASNDSLSTLGPFEKIEHWQRTITNTNIERSSHSSPTVSPGGTSPKRNPILWHRRPASLERDSGCYVSDKSAGNLCNDVVMSLISPPHMDAGDPCNYLSSIQEQPETPFIQQRSKSKEVDLNSLLEPTSIVEADSQRSFNGEQSADTSENDTMHSIAEYRKKQRHKRRFKKKGQKEPPPPSQYECKFNLMELQLGDPVVDPKKLFNGISDEEVSKSEVFHWRKSEESSGFNGENISTMSEENAMFTGEESTHRHHCQAIAEAGKHDLKKKNPKKSCLRISKETESSRFLSKACQTHSKDLLPNKFNVQSKSSRNNSHFCDRCSATRMWARSKSLDELRNPIPALSRWETKMPKRKSNPSKCFVAQTWCSDQYSHLVNCDASVLNTHSATQVDGENSNGVNQVARNTPSPSCLMCPLDTVQLSHSLDVANSLARRLKARSESLLGALRTQLNQHI